MTPDDTAAWATLGSLAETVVAQHGRERSTTAQRFLDFSVRVGQLLIDFSKQRIDERSFEALLELADECGLPAQIERQFAGAVVNNTEQRQALHTALRAAKADCPDELRDAIHSERDRMTDFAERVRNGDWLGSTGRPITHVVAIGIGGSHLGPNLVCEALNQSGIEIRFMTNIDGIATDAALCDLDPGTTLFVVISKTFTTLETMANAHAARSWLIERTCSLDVIPSHFVAVSTNDAAMDTFGIPPTNRFAMWDWVGGRFSLWSSVGLPIAIAIGRQGFEQLLEGAAQMDRHFRDTPIRRNAPAILALLAIWNANFLGAPTHAVLAYDTRLRLLADFLQQLEMESNGKSTRRDGEPTTLHTSPVIWGGEETNGQHAFHQLLHQGTRAFSADFIATINPVHERLEQHQWLLANCLAQSQAMLLGRQHDKHALAPHRAVAGDRSTTTILLDELDARSIGCLIALYEHKVSCLGAIWDINSFDQFGVELGKELAEQIFDDLGSNEIDHHDASTQGLINTIRDRSS